MVNKSKGKAAKGGKSKPPLKKPQQTRQEPQAHQQTPQERVGLVRPLWETLGQDERVKLLTVELENVRGRAKQIAEAARKQAVADAPEGEPLDPALLELEPSIEDVLEEGIKRLKEKGTWKLWQWPTDNAAMYDAESFRQHVTEKHIREELRRLLPRDEGRATEKPAEAAFRQRMLDLLAKVQQSSSANSLRPTVTTSGDDGASRPHRRRGDPGSHLRDANIELLALLLEALARENDHLYHSLLTPITTYVMEILPEGHRETTKLELSFEDLENLLPDDVSRIVEWLTEKVDALSTKLKPEPKDDEEEEEENMGDVDLWALTDEDKGLTVNGRWLQHLQQDRLLGDDGHPRRAKAGEDPARNGLVLEWVYGSIVSTAEKARDGAKRCLGMQPPTALDAHVTLVRALEEHLSWESRAKQCKDLLSEMLKSRLEASELTKQGYDLRPQPTPQPGRRESPGGESGAGSLTMASLTSPLLLEDGTAAPGADSKPLPDEVILFMLRREALLTRAKLHWLVFEHLTQEKELRILKQQLRQGEPEFERLKRELDEVKHQPRMEGAYRNAAEMERHKHQVEVQTAFREQGARLQATYDKKQKAEYDMAKRETEIKQLQGWKGTVENLVDKFQELINSRNERIAAAASAGAEGVRDGGSLETDGDLEAAAGSLTPQQYIQLTKMRNHFIKDVRKQLYGDADDRLFFDNIKTALKAIERRLEDSSVALQHLEMQLINVACDDPGALIGTQLALPLLQERLDARGLEYAAQRAKLAEDEVLKMELLSAEREAAERERKKAAKAKKNEKVKSEKERLAAERQAKEEAERLAKEEAERERVVRDEEERRKRIEAVEAMRKAEEAAIELRRKELLSDENGYWRQRMIMEERLSGMGMAVGAAGATGDGTGRATTPEPPEEAERAGSSSPEVPRRSGDDEGFVTESRRRRFKDTRDQDEEVSTAASAPGGTGSRSHARSGSRDRMEPREGQPPREQIQPHHHHRERDRDREPRRHHASSQGSSHRSGSRECVEEAPKGAEAHSAAVLGKSSEHGANLASAGPSDAGARREAAFASSTNGSGPQSDAFPSLSSSSAGTAPAADVGAVSAANAFSWKAKLQQNVASSSQQPGGGRSPSATANGAPAPVRGSSPRATLNGGVQLASSLSDSAMAHSSGGHAPRPPGNQPSGVALLSGLPSQLLGSVALPLAAPAMNGTDSTAAASPPTVMYSPGTGGKTRPLKLVRGLQNLGGEHNCFLNVTLQSLWHLRCFREAMLALDVESVAARGASPADLAVLRSLVAIFRAMAAQPASAAAWAVSPAPLREALSTLEVGQAAVRLDLAEMHDAFEVLLVVLTCMHRAEAGSNASHGQDPQLPRRVRVRGQAASALANGHHAPAAQPQASGYAAALASGIKAASAASKGAGGASTGVASTVAHSLFGLEVQVPCAAEDDDASSSSGSSGGGKQRAWRDSCNGAVGADSPPPSVAPAVRSGIAGSAGSRAVEDATEIEVYTKYFHLVHAQSLRKAFAALGSSDGGAYFEDVLCAAEAAGADSPLLGGGRRGGTGAPAAVGQGAANGHGPAGWAPGATAAGHPLATLLRFPSVFTLALVWESPQAPLDALRGTLEALGPRLDLALLFRCSSGAAPHSAPSDLRCVICYFGHHYLVFALSEELGLWLLIDDANIQLVGHWGDVVKTMCAKRLQPSLLFYETERQLPGQHPA
ncbi:hypothetical protein GPECTOR_4g934 [Gonium pectorale]|uniref:USP domain-containing protein n=1 Tax=Gonium pectorale TaxID=33097 RepID=A0A150GYS0_GONPE|nr:hypothetical protein GPECTOR_4g934 [Gonium pectorale]|eukprot:KXZ54862.1 hypothetical protein GPECTOR_4g934 [Gonium pectorale]